MLKGLSMEKFDMTKLGQLAGWGYVMAPSYMAVWYGWLDTKYPVAATTRSVSQCHNIVITYPGIFRIIALKVALDQTILTIPLLLVFFPYMSWCQGKENITQELKDKFAVTYAVSCCWWLPAQALNFKFVPPQYRIIYNGACGFVWANILCAIKRSGESTENKLE